MDSPNEEIFIERGIIPICPNDPNQIHEDRIQNHPFSTSNRPSTHSISKAEPSWRTWWSTQISIHHHSCFANKHPKKRWPTSTSSWQIRHKTESKWRPYIPMASLEKRCGININYLMEELKTDYYNFKREYWGNRLGTHISSPWIHKFSYWCLVVSQKDYNPFINFLLKVFSCSISTPLVSDSVNHSRKTCTPRLKSHKHQQQWRQTQVNTKIQTIIHTKTNKPNFSLIIHQILFNLS